MHSMIGVCIQVYQLKISQMKHGENKFLCTTSLKLILIFPRDYSHS
jgi:hypothetical protein